MSLFSLDCDAVSSSVASIESVKSKISQIGDSVSSYDTSNDDGFNFDGAKSAIASNIDACVIKVNNTSYLMNTVIDSHTKLQSSLNFEASEVSSSGSTKNTSNATAVTSSAVATGGAYAYSSSPSGASTSGGGSSPTSQKNNEVEDNNDEDESTLLVNPKTKDDKEKDKDKEDTEYDNADYSINHGNIRHGKPMEPVNNIECIRKSAVFDKETNMDSVVYSSTGYAMIGDRYVISCDKSLGEVGDSIVIVKKDGTKVKCTIGNVTDNKSDRNTINFVVDEQVWDESNSDNVSNGLFNNTSRILVEVEDDTVIKAHNGVDGPTDVGGLSYKDIVNKRIDTSSKQIVSNDNITENVNNISSTSKNTVTGKLLTASSDNLVGMKKQISMEETVKPKSLDNVNEVNNISASTTIEAPISTGITDVVVNENSNLSVGTKDDILIKDVIEHKNADDILDVKSALINSGKLTGNGISSVTGVGESGSSMLGLKKSINDKTTGTNWMRGMFGASSYKIDNDDEVND